MEGECPKNLVFAQTGTSRRKRKETGKEGKAFRGPCEGIV
jgi:hypothetical protein